jgi:hypothetical protein
VSGVVLDIPPAAYSFANYGLIIPQSNSNAATVFNILRSTADSNLPNGQTVCAHGIQDNIAEATDIGIDNPDCTGQNMHYDLGPTNISSTSSEQTNASMVGSTATFTLTSGTFPSTFTAGNLIKGSSFVPTGYNAIWLIQSGGAGSASLTAEAYGCLAPNGICTSGLGSTTDTGALTPDGVIGGVATLSVNTTTLLPVSSSELNTPILMPLANGYVSQGIPLVVDTGANQETVTTASGPNQKGAWTTFTKVHAAGVPVTYNVGNFTLANGVATNTANYNDVQYMWQVTGAGADASGITLCNAQGESPQPNPTCASAAGIGPDHWLIEDVAASQVIGGASDISAIEMGDEGDQTAVTQIPTHIHLRKIWAHGDWTSPYTGTNSVSNAIHEHCIYCSTVDSQVSEIMRPGEEGHGFGYGYGSQQKNNHNWVEGGSSCSLVGGFGPQVSIPNLLAGQDMEWRRNRCTFPYAWLGLSVNGVGNNSNPTWSNSFSFVRKNGFEMKEGNRYVIQGNIIENVDNTGAQDGKAALRRVSNASSGSGGANYWNINANDYEAGNIYRNDCTGIGMQGRSDATSDGLGASFGMTNVLFQNDLMYGVSYDNNPGCYSAIAEGWAPTTGVVEWQGAITEDPTGEIATFVAQCTPLISGNCPAGPLPQGYQQASVSPGDLVQISGCTLFAGFNTPTVSSGLHTIPGVGVPALTGTIPTSEPPTIVFSNNSVAAGSVDNSGNCTFSYSQGWPQNLQVDHVTSILGDNYAFGSGSDYGAESGPPYWRNALLRDSIFIGAGGLGNAEVGEGTIFEQFAADTGTFGIDHTVWPTRTATNYTEYGNNPGYPDSAGCTGNGCSPPSTMYFPGSSCIGWVGACSGAVPLTYPDYHSFALANSSSFYAGNSEDASDGTSVGVNFSVIDTDQTLNQFVCPYPCGSPGPFGDVSPR